MARFDIETKCIEEASEDRFAVFRSWLRDNETHTAYTFTGPSRDDVKAQAVSKAEEIKPPSNHYGFVCYRQNMPD